MKRGDHVIWLRSPGRSFLAGWRVQQIKRVVVRVCRHRIWIKTAVDGKEKIVSVNPDNTIVTEESKPFGARQFYHLNAK